MTNKILTHISLSLRGPSSLPGRVTSIALSKLLVSSRQQDNSDLDNKLLAQLIQTAEKLVIKLAMADNK